MKKPFPAGQSVFWALIAGSVFISCISFLGFLNRYSAPSNQKWAALSCSIIGAMAVIVIWRMRNEFFFPQPKSVAPVQKRPVEEQRRYYRNNLYVNLAAGSLGSLAYWLIATFFGLSGGLVWAVIGYVVAMTSYQAIKAAVCLYALRNNTKS